MAGPLYQRLLSTRQRHRALKVMDSTSSGLCPQGFEFPRTRSLGLKLDERSTLADVRVRMTGVEPGSQAWEACMIPLHYMRCAMGASACYLCVERLNFGFASCREAKTISVNSSYEAARMRPVAASSGENFASRHLSDEAFREIYCGAGTCNASQCCASGCLV